ncbi:MAG: phosphoribosylamine--glycine ligase [Pseudomonadota bacterium]|nr:phosphoribosylamine--glycine ligase [Pseudomonadota bacterium]
MNKRVMIIGKGGREHALAWKFASYDLVEKVYCVPGNPGTGKEEKVENIYIEPSDIRKLLDFAIKEKIDLTVVGPEGPLVEGIVDKFSAAGQKCFGPSKKAAQLEGSKVFAKEFFTRHGIPSASYRVFSDHDSALNFLKRYDFPAVIKVDGLAAGKGVTIVKNIIECEQILDDIFNKKVFGLAGSRIVVEEFIPGEELSYICMINQSSYLSFASSQDHKARDDGDKGPNTGGMGAYSPAVLMNKSLEKKIVDTVIIPTLKGIKKDGLNYTGFLYAGLMIDENKQIKVLEFNCRFGDPEAQPVLMRLKTNLFNACLDMLENKNNISKLDFDAGTALTVVLAAKGYPGKFLKNIKIPINADNKNNSGTNIKIFHAGTYIKNDEVLSNGGRVLNVSSLSKDLKTARAIVYKAIDDLKIKDLFYRLDIGEKGLKKN